MGVPLGCVVRGDPLSLSGAPDVALIAHWDLPGCFAPSVTQLASGLAAEGIRPVIVSSALGAREYAGVWQLPDSAVVIARPNVGYDFGSWSAARTLLPLDGARVFLTNDSMLGPFAALTWIVASARDSRSDLWGLTGSLQIRPHVQSYFLRFTPELWSSPRIDQFFSSVRPRNSKMAVVRSYELGLSDLVKEIGASTAVAIPPSVVRAGRTNPTVFRWRELLERGVPFLKRTLLTDARVRVSYENLAAEVWRVYGVDLAEFWPPQPDPAASQPQRSSQRTQCRSGMRLVTREARAALSGACPVPALMRRASADSPLDLVESSGTPGNDKVLVIHSHYPELLADLMARTSTLGSQVDVIVTTTGTIPPVEIPPNVTSWRVYRVPNRGRDILPLVRLANQGLLDGYALVGKVHTKKSTWRKASARFASDGDTWRRALVDAVLAPTSVASISEAFRDDPRLMLATASGQLLGPEYWGADLPLVRQLADRVGLSFDPQQLLFASGSMYWARGALLRQLGELGLTSGEFEPERGQDDGTTAHAVERFLGILAQAQGHQRDDLLGGGLA